MTGIVKFLGEERAVGENGLRIKEFVLEEDTDQEYKHSILFEVFNEKIDLVKDYKEGDKIKVVFNTKAREYNGRWFNRMSPRKIEKITS